MAKDAFNEAAQLPPPYPKRAPRPYSIRFSWNERAQLDTLANGRSWATYIKSVLFPKNPKSVSKALTRPKTDHKMLAQILGALGKSRIASNINQLARAANSGSLVLDEETRKKLNEGLNMIEWIKVTLIKGLGLKPHRAANDEDVSDDHKR